MLLRISFYQLLIYFVRSEVNRIVMSFPMKLTDSLKNSTLSVLGCSVKLSNPDIVAFLCFT